MKRRVVMFDIDGVLANFYEGYRRVQAALGMEPCTSERWDDWWNDEVWAVIKSSADFHIGLQSLVDRDTFARIDDLNYAHDVYFVTARRTRDAKLQTQRWLRMRGISSPTVVISHRKGEAAAVLGADFAIDDKYGNAYTVSILSRTTRSFVLDVPPGCGIPHNQIDHAVIGGKVTRVKTVDDFLDEVTR